MGVFRQKSGIHPFFLSESYEIVPKSRFSPSSDAQITKKEFHQKKQRIINDGVQLTLSLLISYISDSYIIPASFVLPHILGDNANVCISFCWIFITFLKHL